MKLVNKPGDWTRKLLGSELTKKATETIGTRGIVMALGFAMSVVVARILGPEGRGLFFVATTVGAVGVQFGNLGLHASNTYFVAKDPTLLPKLLGNSLVIGLLIGLLISTVLFLSFQLVPSLAPLTGNLLNLALLWIPVGLSYLLLQNLLLGVHRIRSFNFVELGSKLFVVALFLILVVKGVTSVEVYFFAAFIGLLVSVIWALKVLLNVSSNAIETGFSLLREHLSYGFKAYAGAFFAFVVLRSDILVIQHLLGATETGFYSISVALIDVIYMLPATVGAIVFPRLSSMSNPTEKWKSARQISVVIMIGMLMITLLFALVGDQVIVFLYGNEFAPAIEPFYWLLPGVLFLGINTIYMNYFASIGMPWVTVFSPLIAATINVWLNFIWIPQYGIIAAAVSSSLAYGLMLAISRIYIARARL